MKRGEEKKDTRVVGKTFLDFLLCLRLLDGLLEVDGGGGHGVCVGAKRLEWWDGVWCMERRDRTWITAKLTYKVMSQLTSAYRRLTPPTWHICLHPIHIHIYTYIRLDKPPKRLVALPAMVPDQLAAEVRLFDNAGEGFADVWGYFVLEP